MSIEKNAKRAEKETRPKNQNPRPLYHVDDESQPRNRAERRREVRNAGEQNMHDLLRFGVQGLAVQTAVEKLLELMDEEAEELCGAPKGKHSSERQAYRNGTVKGYVYSNSRKLQIDRIRLQDKNTGQEIQLEAYRAAQDPRFLNETVLINCLSGVSCRRTEGQVETSQVVPDDILVTGSSGLRKSRISDRVIAKTQLALDELLARPLDGEDYVVLWLDGLRLAEHQLIAGIGLTSKGEKHVLGVWHGSAESTAVCQSFLMDLDRRGLRTEDGILAVIDGGKGLHSAINKVWGSRVRIQRCQVHKKRNVAEHLPEDEASAVLNRMSFAWRSDTATKARSILVDLANQLEADGHARAAASLREGMAETLTCLRLQVPSVLMGSLTNTNVIESGFSTSTSVCRRVKRWRNGNQAQRWVAVSLLEAEKSFKKVRGADALGALSSRLKQAVRKETDHQALTA